MENSNDFAGFNIELEPFPLCGEGMPPPGKDFIAAAVAMGDPLPEFQGKKKEEKLVSHGPILEDLYRRACFDPTFQLPMALKSGVKEQVPFLIGHRYGGGEAHPTKDLRGPYPAKVMVVTKMPSREDISDGWYFRGAPGEVLRRALDELNVDPESISQWYVTAVVKHQLIDRGTTRLSAGAIANCAPILEREIRLVNPQYILCFGAEAAAAVLGKKVVSTVGAAQGRVFDKKIPGRETPIKVVVCANPNNVCRDEGEYPDFLTGLFRFISLVETGKAVEREPLDAIRIYSERHLKMVVDEILKHPEGHILAVDCEWHGDYPSEPNAYLRTIQFTHRTDRAYMVVFRKASGIEVFTPDKEACIDHLKRLFLDTPERKVRLVGHNLRADLPWIFSLDHDLGAGMAAQFTAPDDDPVTGRTGPERTATEGGFDTMIAAHAVQEVAGHLGYKLEVLTSRYTGTPRWDFALQEWKKSYCSANGIKDKELEGYGECPDDVLLGSVDGKTISYAGWDVAGALKLFHIFNAPDGMLNYDRYGNNCRKPFWIAMRASPAFLEMEQTGLRLFPEKVHELTVVYRKAAARKLAELRETIHWPQYNPNSVIQTRDLLFGPGLSGKYDATGKLVTVIPADVRPLYIQPLVTTGKPAKLWKEIAQRGEQGLYSPATSKDVLTAFLETEPKETEDQKYAHHVIGLLRDVRYLNSLLARVLSPEDFSKEETDGNEEDFDRGLASWVHSDGLIRSHFFPTQETGRCSTVRPPLQNLCLDEDTEYLTDRGWVNVKDFDFPMKVAQYDNVTCAITFVVPSEIHKSYYEGSMCRWASEYVDLLLTPNHRLPIRTFDGRMDERRADDVMHPMDRFVVSGFAQESYQNPIPYFGAVFVGMMCALKPSLVDKGGGKSVVFSSQNSYVRELIIAVAHDAGIAMKVTARHLVELDTSVPTAGKAMERILHATAFTAKLGQWVMTLSHSSMATVADSYLRWTRQAKKQSDSDKDWLAVMVVCSGKRLAQTGKTYKTIDTARRSDEAPVAPWGRHTPVPYAGNVYCVTVPSSWIVVRRNGKPCIVGNSKNRETDYQKMLGTDYVSPIRSMLGAPAGWVTVEADFIGAELYTVAVQSGSAKMADHCSRSELPDSDPNKYDIHSSLAVFCFRLKVESEDVIKSAAKKLGVPRESLTVKVNDPLPANKTWLAVAGKKGLRDAVKAIVFGLLYGRSDQAVVNAVEQQGIKLTLAEAGDIRKAIFQTYPELEQFMLGAQQRVVEQRWMANWCGRYRRFGTSSDKKIISEMKRQAGNFGIQSGVADLVNLAIAALYRVPDRFDEKGPRFLMALQVHDAVMFHVRPDSLEWFLGPGGHDGILQKCMSGIPMRVADFDGNVVAGTPEYHLPVEWSVMINWGVPLTREQALELKVPEFLIPAK